MTISTAGMVFAVVIFIATLAASIEVKPGNLSYAQVVPAPNPMCKPGDAHINGTESRECGIPKTISSPSPANTTTTPAGTITSMTTGAPKPLSPSSSPSSTQPLAENATTPQGDIPGILP
jgi:hypothetical protein